MIWKWWLKSEEKANEFRNVTDVGEKLMSSKYSRRCIANDYKTLNK